MGFQLATFPQNPGHIASAGEEAMPGDAQHPVEPQADAQWC